MATDPRSSVLRGWSTNAIRSALGDRRGKLVCPTVSYSTLPIGNSSTSASADVAGDHQVLAVWSPIRLLYVVRNRSGGAAGDRGSRQGPAPDPAVRRAASQLDRHLSGFRDRKNVGARKRNGNLVGAVGPLQEEPRGLPVPGCGVHDRLPVGREPRRLDPAAAVGQRREGRLWRQGHPLAGQHPGEGDECQGAGEAEDGAEVRTPDRGRGDRARGGELREMIPHQANSRARSWVEA